MTTIAETAELAWGYTMADINRAAGISVSKHRFSAGLDFDDRLACAWYGVVVELYSRDDPPTFHELLRAGLDALGEENGAYRRHHGRPNEDGEPTTKFLRYWLPVQRQKHYTDDGFSERLCENLALHDALAVLTPNQYEALSTLAAFDNVGARAAEALGMEYKQFMHLIYRGRAAVKEVWYGDETPPKRPFGNTCKSGHSRAEHGRQRPSDGAWVCAECNRASGRKSARKRRERERGEKMASLAS